MQAFEFGADVAESKTGNETSVASVSRAQAVKNAIKSFVPDRETEAKLIALGLKGEIKVGYVLWITTVTSNLA